VFQLQLFGRTLFMNGGSSGAAAGRIRKCRSSVGGFRCPRGLDVMAAGPSTERMQSSGSSHSPRINWRLVSVRPGRECRSQITAGNMLSTEPVVETRPRLVPGVRPMPASRRPAPLARRRSRRSVQLRVVRLLLHFRTLVAHQRSRARLLRRLGRCLTTHGQPRARQTSLLWGREAPFAKEPLRTAHRQIRSSSSSMSSPEAES